ncbi:MAG: hypothetical protein CMN78_04530 [Spirochaetales bacterium]|nr:hypothetical protein [Spirochaetales bacterium]
MCTFAFSVLTEVAKSKKSHFGCIFPGLRKELRGNLRERSQNDLGIQNDCFPHIFAPYERL